MSRSSSAHLSAAPSPPALAGSREPRRARTCALLVALAGISAAALGPAQAGAAVPDYDVVELPAPVLQDGAGFGERMRTLGDVDDDGIRDLLVSSSNYSGNGGALSRSGRLYVFSGRTRALLHTIDPPDPQKNGKLGFWSANLGDVNGDGAADFVTSAPGTDSLGRVYIISGRSGGVLRSIDPPEDLTPTGAFGGDFGGNLIGPGDLTGDGVGDFVATASGAFNSAGAAFAFNGATGEFLYKVSNPSLQTSSLGFGAAEIGDLNGDGAGEYQIGAPRFDELDLVDAGRSYVIDGVDGDILYTLRNPEPEANDRFGQADADGASLGDITGDGTPDIYVDTFLADEGALPNAGTVYLFNGATGKLIRPLRDPAPRDAATFGASNASAGDVDGDGSPDSLVSSRGGGVGRVLLFGGSELRTLLTAFEDPANQAGALFGSSIASPGDLNGDGLPDYFISARSADIGTGDNVGTAYAFLSKPPPAPPKPTPTPTPTPSPTPPGDGGVTRVRPNLQRPGFARARATRAGNRIVVRLRGRMRGNRGRRCGGRLKIGTRAGSRRVAVRIGRMGSNCRYAERYAFPVRRLPRRLRPRNKTVVLRIALRFQGNSLLRPDNSPQRRVRVRR